MGLRLGVHRLPAAEAGLLRALVTLEGSGRAAGRGPWVFLPEGPCDALVADATDAHAADAACQRGARALLLLGQTGQLATAETLPRPLRLDQFASWLRRTESLLEVQAPPARPAAAARAPAPEPRHRLRRWPPAELLRPEPQRARMAAVLSRRPLTASELAAISQQDVDACRRFLQLLGGFGLLETQADLPRPAALPPAAGSARAGLIRTIRRRLGL